MIALRIPFLGVEVDAEKIIFNIRFALGTTGAPWQIESAEETLSMLRALHSSNIFSSSTLLMFFYENPFYDAQRHFTTPLFGTRMGLPRGRALSPAGHYHRALSPA